jgi:hypothetical protein
MGWTNIPVQPTYVSATSMLFTGIDLTAHLTGYVKCRWYQSGWRYGYVVSSSLGSGNTTAVLVTNTSYTVANAAITNFSISYGNPVDFPGLFSYTPTGISATNVTHVGKFSIQVRRCFVDYTVDFSGAITFTTMPTLPTPVSAGQLSRSLSSFGNAGYYDAGVGLVIDTLFVIVVASGATFSLVNSNGAAISATNPITWANGDVIEAHFSYEI